VTFERRRTELLAQLVLGAGGLLIIGPFLWVLAVSLKTPGQYASDPWSWVPQPPSLDGYAQVFTLPVLTWGWNTLVIVALSTVGQVVSCALVAYPLARLQFRLRDLVFLLAIATMMLPSQVLLIPQYLLFNWLGWVNTPLPLIVPQYFALSGIFVFFLRQYYRHIPQDLEDAVAVDGGGVFSTFRHVIVPLSIPAYATVAILHIVGSYNDFFYPLIYLQSRDAATLAIGAAQLRPNPLGGYSFSVQTAMAGTVLFALPLIIVYALAHRSVIDAVEVGSGLNA
jgi:multiple sugar transport system permease protein